MAALPQPRSNCCREKSHADWIRRIGSAEVGCREGNGGGGCVLMSRFIYDTEQPLTLKDCSLFLILSDQLVALKTF